VGTGTSKAQQAEEDALGALLADIGRRLTGDLTSGNATEIVRSLQADVQDGRYELSRSGQQRVLERLGQLQGSVDRLRQRERARLAAQAEASHATAYSGTSAASSSAASSSASAPAAPAGPAPMAAAAAPAAHPVAPFYGSEKDDHSGVRFFRAALLDAGNAGGATRCLRPKDRTLGTPP
jgi:hypothetical protein